MRASNLLILTSKEIPSKAEFISHKLMLRSGMIRSLASGIYTWLPIGIRVLKNFKKLVRKEMDFICANEVLMSSIQPIELWKESNRYKQYGPELLRFKDRKKREFCLCPTNEEVITDLIRREILSYKHLPLILYQITTKFRDELRPRFGLIRAREFIMKDAYSFHINNSCLDNTYNIMYDAYNRILNSCCVDYRSVIAENGTIGGFCSHEFHILASSGEDKLVLSNNSKYAANNVIAEALSRNKKNYITKSSLTIIDLKRFNKFYIKTKVKMLIVSCKRNKLLALLLVNNHKLNNIKFEKHFELSKPLKLLTNEDILNVIGEHINFLGPIGLNLPIVVDKCVSLICDFTAGANQNNKVYVGINWNNDLPLPNIVDLRHVLAGEYSPDCVGKLLIKRSIEVGHIFKLGTKYSNVMNAKFMSSIGINKPFVMGCYGIGLTRIIAATIENNNDKYGIVWPEKLAPFEIVLIPINSHKTKEVIDLSEKLYTCLIKAQFDVLLDDRDIRLGHKLTEWELIGIPHRIFISERNKPKIEYNNRKNKKSIFINPDDLIHFLTSKNIFNFF
ncbi:Prolyl-tRNA synthetase bacterial type [Candidatus Portiera aleyrodidarum BT-B-HRs]|uniref:proline--tRNA ligase n=1 Tax=Candidatus Portiera aleyrodidarum TaxID=91844 RepID=UPI00027B30D2|nr:proline--tRNA ligase [Candidatus Portiera aleyrodidarum]AFQ24159.1 prolyl-tRNA synthetase [Candidatus Portiera aleyrodidarum BT-B-HRs]AFT80839.1 Prolyl-tRNA synthetase bacterial type [Candidatus Portiera aleyrodidarum BT-B-HRs]ASX27282.1 proline--tRNA ligase [Candidatus Portiera aleyrodidarum MED (Bemisia tabaci)]